MTGRASREVETACRVRTAGCVTALENRCGAPLETLRAGTGSGCVAFKIKELSSQLAKTGPGGGGGGVLSFETRPSAIKKILCESSSFDGPSQMGITLKKPKK